MKILITSLHIGTNYGGKKVLKRPEFIEASTPLYNALMDIKKLRGRLYGVLADYLL